MATLKYKDTNGSWKYVATDISDSIPTASKTSLGGIIVGDNLVINNGVLSVDVAHDVEADNTKPITAAAVHTEIGNIEVLLATI